MEQSVETKKESRNSNKLLIAVIAAATVIIAVAIVIVAVVVLNREEPSSPNSLSIGYAANAKVFLDEESIQKAFDEASKNAQDNNIGLRYKNNAFSSDGINFDCHIENSGSNIYDMFLTIFSDAELSDQIFLSELVPPGSGFESITLDKELEKGDHTVYVVLTQVDINDEGEQVMVGQVAHTMEFHVS